MATTDAMLKDTSTAHAAESQHWYTKDGKPAYTVIGANGKERPATLRDARKLGLLPSVTSIIRLAAAPGLENWKIRQAVLSALTHPGLKGTDEDIQTILADAKEEGIRAAERGTAVHAALQAAFQGEDVPQEYLPHVQGAKAALEAAYGPQNWVAEQSFACDLGYGGKVDLACGHVTVDFKTKEFGKDDPLPKPYEEHAMQLAAYGFGLRNTVTHGGIVFVSVTEPGLCHVAKIPDEDMQKGWDMFRCLLNFHRAKTGYAP